MSATHQPNSFSANISRPAVASDQRADVGPFLRTPRFDCRSYLLWVAALAGGIASASGQSRPRFLPQAAPAAEARADWPDHALAELVADTMTIQPGAPFRLGVHFRIEPEWHMYWRYAGEVGYPTEIIWELPEGFTAGEIQWPNPRRFDDPIAGTSYAYEDEVLLFTLVQPPPSLAEGQTLRFGARADWLVCKIECVPGQAEAGLELPVGEPQPSAASPLFERFAARVPVDPLTLADRVAVSARPEALRLGRGETVRQTIEIEARRPWAALLSTPEAEAQLFPDGGEAWVASRHPSSATGLGPPLEPDRGAFGGVRVDWPIETQPDAQPGEHRLRAALTLPLVNLETGEGGAIFIQVNRSAQIEADVQTPVASVPAAASGASGGRPGSEAPAEETTPLFSFLAPGSSAAGVGRSAWLFLFFAFVGGLILNVMPCVLPVLSLKVLSFVRQAEEDRRRVLRLGLIFALGVFVSFALLATLVVGLKAAGAQIGWGFQFQEPRFLIIMSALVFAFGLSLFGVYEIDLTPSAGRGLARLGGREGGAGSFMNGVLATALATPCTAPLLGPALGFAFSQSPAMIYVFFFAIAAGLASPYVLLAAEPRWLRVIPKPGPWTVAFKQFMGLLLMATVIWLLWVLGRQAGADAIVWTLAFLLVVGLGCAVVGAGLDLRAGRLRRGFSLAAGLALAVGAYIFFPERYLRDLRGRLDEASEAKAAPSETTTLGGIEWEPFSVVRVEELVAERRTVFIDLTADWCLTCKVNERAVLASEDVAEAFRRHRVAAIRGDYTRQPPELTRLLRQFGRAGVPMYVIFPAGRPQEPILLPEVLTTSLVLDRLEEAAATTRLASGDPTPTDS